MADKINNQIHFGTEGWRGIIAEDFTFENVIKVSQAIANCLRKLYTNQKKNSLNHLISKSLDLSIIVGYDNRFLSDRFAITVAETFLNNGFQATVTNTSVSTPNLCYYLKESGEGSKKVNIAPRAARLVLQSETRKGQVSQDLRSLTGQGIEECEVKNQQIGIMITASHNPPIFNGLKIKAPYGGPVPDWFAKEVESVLSFCPTSLFLDKKKSKQKKNQFRQLDIKQQYIDYLKLSTDFNQIKKLKIAFDCMHGCAMHYLTELFHDNLNKIIQIRNFADPLFGFTNPEPIENNLNPLKKAVIENYAGVGIAFDGDADRIGVIDDNGNYLAPHIVFPLLLYYLVKYKKLTGKVVQAISLGYISERIAKKFNLPFEEVPVGFKYITEKILKCNDAKVNLGESASEIIRDVVKTSDGTVSETVGDVAQQDVLIGGEESGGYAFYSSEIPERDGVLAGLILIEMLGYTGKKLSELVKELQKEFGKSYFLRTDIKLPEIIFDKSYFTNKIQNLISTKLFGIIVSQVKTYDGLKIILQDDSWVMLRPSGTEPVLRIYAEASSREFANKLIEYGKKLTRSVISCRKKD